MSEQEKHLSRRNFLRMVGAAGGAAAVHETLVTLGLMNHPRAWAGPPERDPNLGGGKKVLILGAGVGGLTLAYWLADSGYSVTILEANASRLGGRNFTARGRVAGSPGRRGDIVEEDGAEPQECKFDEDERLYANLGPGRIPYHHLRVLDLCRELDVPLEVYVHTSHANLHKMSGAPPYVRRQLAYDTQGYIAELLAKAINQGELAKEVTGDDRERLRGLLRKFGDLNQEFRYRGTSRAGCAPTIKRECDDTIDDPMGLRALLRSEFWDPCRVGAPAANCDPADYKHGFYQVDEYLWQTTSFQPVGGMDKIVQKLDLALLKKGVRITRGAQVKEISRGEDGRIGVIYGDGKKMTADLCVNNIPFTVYSDIELRGFDEEYATAIGRRPFSNACKVGWQANRRFWELDRHIYGGISWTEHEMTQMWYPSNDYFAPKGVLTGAYNYGETARKFGDLSFDERLDAAYRGAVELHGQAFRDAVPKDRGISIAWQKVRFQRGCSAVWNRPDDDDATRRRNESDYERLLIPDLGGKFFVVGDQISTLPGWQEGALMSAEHVFGQITRGQDLDLETLRREVEAAPMSIHVMG